MTNRFYARGGERVSRVQELFGMIASRYDLINDIQSLGLHRLWKRRLIRLARLQPGDSVLDVCCGTGDIALRFALAGAQVTGIDFSEPMLAVARRRAMKAFPPQEGLQSDGSSPKTSAPRDLLEFRQGDAMRLSFQDDKFAAVAVSYGLRNLEDWKVGLQEMARVARPGGRILVLDFGKPANGALRALYFLYLRLMVPLFGLLVCRNAAAYAYILESLHHYPAQEGVAVGMRELGLERVEIHNLLGGMMSLNVGVKVVAKPRND